MRGEREGRPLAKILFSSFSGGGAAQSDAQPILAAEGQVIEFTLHGGFTELKTQPLTTTATSNAEETIDYLRQVIVAGEHWYIALLKAMSRWSQAEEEIDGRKFQYLIGGEAFDYLLLCERLIDELGGMVGARDRDALLFHGHPPLEIEDEEFQELIGTPKYQAYLNYLYGVVVEESLQLAVEEEVAKEHHGHVWSAGRSETETAFERLYGKPQTDLLQEFLKERGADLESKELQYTELKEFTYWLFKYRVRSHEGARVASDTRKGLAALSRVELAFRRRMVPEQAPNVQSADEDDILYTNANRIEPRVR